MVTQQRFHIQFVLYVVQDAATVLVLFILNAKLVLKDIILKVRLVFDALVHA